MTQWKLMLAAAGASLLLFVLLPGGIASAAAPLPDPKVDEPRAARATKEIAFLAGGCFWGVQAVFEHVKGVKKVTAGYAGGTLKDPSYEEVSTETTGHAESVEVVYDASQVTYGELLQVFFSVAHDPTQLNRQGPDVGTSYRSAVFFATPDQQRIARAYVDQLTADKAFSAPIVTEITPFQAFYRAEDYHQDFLVHNPTYPYIVYNDLPKLAHLKAQFPSLYVKYP